jgi:cytochrome oxidase assembly protein ShyY1
VPILTGFLGIWQIRRLQWKVALIDEVDRNLAREPMALPNRIKWVGEDFCGVFGLERLVVWCFCISESAAQ